VLAGLVGSCSSGSSSASRATATPSPEAPAIVGVWERTQTCVELERVLTAAGLRAAVARMVAEDGWVPGVTSPAQLADPAHPCQGAVTRKHSHFFTADGQFGSRDAMGEQVDDGSYQLVDPDVVVIGDAGVRFHYRITGGTTLMLDPVMPSCAPTCFEAMWSVAVAYPGYAWHRVG
jgi:hypothetical protein